MYLKKLMHRDLHYTVCARALAGYMRILDDTKIGIVLGTMVHASAVTGSLKWGGDEADD